MNISVEMPSGARSRGYDREEKDALKTFESVAAQLSAWPKFQATVILADDLGEDLHRRNISNA